MKKISTHHRIFIYALLLISVIFYGCDETKNAIIEKENIAKINGRLIDIYIIDSCEYIGSVYSNVDIITHKGNCKFCAERNKNNSN